MTSPASAVKNELRTDNGTLELSVVIPTLNAASALQGVIGSVGAVHEIIVVDGGSSDDSVAIARRAGARVLTAPRGRGTQIRAGVVSARPGWVFILHADTRMAPDWRSAAAHHMLGSSMRAASFRFALDSADREARRLERLVAWRCRVWCMPYGDQGLLIHTDLLARIGGVRPLPLMEDVDLIRRIGRDRLVMLAPSAITSATKWHASGWYRRSARNLLCLTLWFMGIPPGWIARLYR